MIHRWLPNFSKWLFVLTALLLYGVMSLFMEDHRALASFSGSGSGTSVEDPYIIETAEQLDEVRNDLNGHYRLKADIDLSAEGYTEWVPIGGSALVSFKGTFDGNGHTISNLKIDSNGSFLGLFGGVSGAEIRNLGLVNVDIKGGLDNEYVGGLAGWISDSNVEYVYVTGKVSAYTKVGGLAGNSTLGHISHSYAAVEVSGAGDVGGLVGYKEGFPAVDYAYWDNELTATSALGEGKITTDMKQAHTFDGWNFSDEGSGQWRIIGGVTYPMLSKQFDRIALDSLTVDEGGVPLELEPPFTDGKLTYSARVTSDVYGVTVTAAPKNDASNVLIDGKGDSEPIALNLGENTVSIAVYTDDTALPGTAVDPFVIDYTLTIVREDGTSLYPHSISTADQLADIGTGTYEMDDHYLLTNDLDLADYANWDPIGDNGTPFTGQFDGNYHTINHLTIDRGTEDRVGLFGKSSGMILNVGLENADVNGKSQVGALIGENAGTVTNVYSIGEVTGESDIGGLIGLNSGIGNLNYTYFAGYASDSGQVGGLIGNDPSTGAVLNSYFTLASEEVTSASTGGEEKTSAEMRQKLTFSEWDFDDKWAIMDGTTYPMWKSHFEALELNSLTVTPSDISVDWTPTPFSSAQGVYTIVMDHYVTEVDVAATLADSDAIVSIDGVSGTALTKSVLPGDNAVSIEISKPGVAIKGKYLLNIQVPVPAITGVTVANGYYGVSDMLALTASYEGDVVVTGGTPRLPILIGTDTVYALYAGQPDGDLSKLNFEYEVPAGLADADGVELVTPIDLPASVAITANGLNVPLGFTAPVTSGVQIDSIAPSITLSQTPDDGTPTKASVTITADIKDLDSGIDAVKWSEGIRSAAFFGSGGTTLTDDSFDVGANGTYTVYARDAAGNEAVQEILIPNVVAPPPAAVGDEGTVPCRDGSCLYLRAGVAGEFSIDGITIEIPAGATDVDLTLTLEQVTLPDDSPIFAGQSFLSPVFEAHKTNEGKFLKPITLRIVYLPVEVKQGQLAFVFYYDETAGQWVKIGGESQDSTITVQVDHFTKFAVLAVDDPLFDSAGMPVFSDIEGHWAQEAILEAVKNGIIQGYPDHTFRPDDPVTRAEFAVMLMKRFGWETPNDKELTFRDRMDVPSWAVAAIEIAVQKGVMSGYPDHTIRPNESILRTEMAAILAQAMQLPQPEDLSIAFKDSDSIPEWAKPYAVAVAQAGIMQGDEQQRFNPTARTTRAEAAVVLIKSLAMEEM